MSKKKISILGSTGSIGISALEVIDANIDRFEVVGLAAGANVNLLAEQIRRFKPKVVSVKDDNLKDLLYKIVDVPVEILSGIKGATSVALANDVDMVLSAMVGAVGLKPTFEAIKAGKDIALANKETLVAGGQFVINAVKENNTLLLPVDSEHSAIFQSLVGHRKKDIRKLILTASGGPFWSYNDDFETITVEQALKHPNWSMGSKITIDSATMMNKGLEIIEACWLFDMPESKVNVLIHPQSIVHSMVEYKDSSIVAQMGQPDMKGPISYALAYPERVESRVEELDLAKLSELTFYDPDCKKFPMIELAREAFRKGGAVPVVMNAANEVAVDAFLNKKIGFCDIYRAVCKAVETMNVKTPDSIDDIIEIDKETRRIVASCE